jgi:hypothetical protein
VVCNRRTQVGRVLNEKKTNYPLVGPEAAKLEGARASVASLCVVTLAPVTRRQAPCSSGNLNSLVPVTCGLGGHCQWQWHCRVTASLSMAPTFKKLKLDPLLGTQIHGAASSAGPGSTASTGTGPCPRARPCSLRPWWHMSALRNWGSAWSP